MAEEPIVYRQRPVKTRRAENGRKLYIAACDRCGAERHINLGYKRRRNLYALCTDCRYVLSDIELEQWYDPIEWVIGDDERLMSKRGDAWW